MKFLFTILFFYIVFNGFTQNPDIKRTYHWYFGANAGIDFSSGQAVADTNGQVNTWDGCSSISDETGNLLFYTDGSTVWNKNHAVMQNGTGLWGHWSSHQNSLIVPKPLNNFIYYIFTTDAQEHNFAYGLNYSVVDMTLDGGFGAVTNKNILLVAPTHEALQATYHSNCRDIWVITHKRNQEKFYAYLVTAQGISAPVISTIGNATGLLWGSNDLKISPKGNKIVSSNFWDWWNTGVVDTIELYDFNNATGYLSNRITLTADTGNMIGNFSPDNSKLYVMGGGNAPNVRFYQFDMNSPDINQSKQIVFDSYYTIYAYDAQFSPVNGKLYFTRANTDSLAIIHNPNALGIACNFQDAAFYLNGKQSMASFPNFISSYFDTDTTNCFTLVNSIQSYEISINVTPNPFYSITSVTIEGINSCENYTLSLFNYLGQLQPLSYNLISSDNNLSFTLYRNQLKEGIYLLKIQNNNHVFSEKLIITN